MTAIAVDEAPTSSSSWRANEYQSLRETLTLSLTPAPSRPGAPALDLGCGDGRYARALAERGYRVLAVDQDARRIAEARERNAHRGVRFEVASLEEVLRAPEERYELALGLEIIEHLPRPEPLLGGLYAALAPGGRLVLSTPNRVSLEAVLGTLRQLLRGDLWNAWDPTHRHIYSHGELGALLRGHGFHLRRSEAFHFGARSGGGWLARLGPEGTLPGLPRSAECWPLNRLGYKLLLVAERGAEHEAAPRHPLSAEGTSA